MKEANAVHVSVITKYEMNYSIKIFFLKNVVNNPYLPINGIPK